MTYCKHKIRRMAIFLTTQMIECSEKHVERLGQYMAPPFVIKNVFCDWRVQEARERSSKLINYGNARECSRTIVVQNFANTKIQDNQVSFAVRFAEGFDQAVRCIA